MIRKPPWFLRLSRVVPYARWLLERHGRAVKAKGQFA